MSLPEVRRVRFRRIANRARGIAARYGLREHRVYILDSAFSGDHTGDGTQTDTETEITEYGSGPPKVRWLNDEQTALADGIKGLVDIGPVTPEHTGGGTDLNLLVGRDLTTGDMHKIRIVGPMHPDGATYRVTKVTAHRAFQFMIRAAPLDLQVE